MTGAQFGTVRLATGPSLHYVESGNAGGPVVVFLHGWPDSSFSYSRVVPLLSPPFHVFAPDQRGYGDSERPANGYAIDDFATDVVAFLDSQSLSRASLVGHSFGSFVARRVAIAHPERVSRLALIGTGFTSANPVTREVQASIRDLSDPVSPEFARAFQSGTAYAPLPEPFFDRIVAESLKLPARLWRETFDGLLAYEDAGELPRIAAPTLLIWGEHDALFPREDQHRVAAAIPGARLEVYAQTGHCPNWERPERVAADLQAFLQP